MSDKKCVCGKCDKWLQDGYIVATVGLVWGKCAVDDTVLTKDTHECHVGRYEAQPK